MFQAILVLIKSGVSKLQLQLLVLLTFVVSGRCHGHEPWQRLATTNASETRGCNYSLEAPDDER